MWMRAIRYSRGQDSKSMLQPRPIGNRIRKNRKKECIAYLDTLHKERIERIEQKKKERTERIKKECMTCLHIYILHGCGCMRKNRKKEQKERIERKSRE